MTTMKTTTNIDVSEGLRVEKEQAQKRIAINQGNGSLDCCRYSTDDSHSRQKLEESRIVV